MRRPTVSFDRARTRWPLLALLLLSVLFGCSSRTKEQRTVSLPRLTRAPVELRVAYVVNPRLPRMDGKQLQVLLAAVQSSARDHFGVELRFTPIVEIPIEVLFQKIPQAQRLIQSRHIYDFKSGNGDRQRLEREFGKGLESSGEPLAAMIGYAQPHLGKLKDSTYQGLGAALARLQLERVEGWKTVRALDGRPAIDASPYNETQMWLALGFGEVPYDLVLTNQILVSVEDVNPEVHAALRGGYCNGITTYSKASRYGTYSVWSTFAFTSDDPWVRSIRGGETYTPEEGARLAGIGATHELGHQLFHFLHAFGNDACVMNPVPMFGYRSWASKLDPAACPVGSSPAMQQGAVKFSY